MENTQSLEDILLKMELITREQLTEALEFQCRLPQSQSMPLADILIDMEYVSLEAIEGIEDYLSRPAQPASAEAVRQSVNTMQADAPRFFPAEAVAQTPVTPSAPEPVTPPAPPVPAPVAAPVSPAANEAWQQMHAMEEWQQMQSMCIEQSQGDSDNLGKIMDDLGISDPKALQVGFTIKRKP